MLGRRVVVGVSGGVDSSVSALLLRQSGKFDQVIGVFMRNWDPGDESGDSYTCPAAADFRDARKVCEEIGIPIQRVDFVKEYWNKVFEPYLDRFQAGGTPNPDVFCNKEIKFKAFRQFVLEEFGPDTHIATGHYARLQGQLSPHTGMPKLLQGLDESKDQTYFLCAVPGEAFRNVHFPVGGLRKSMVREIATEAKLCTAKKKDSVGICFVGKRSFPEFISEYIPPHPGRFIGVNGEDYGPHPGVHLFTIGQKASISGAASKLFVVDKNVNTGDITVAPATHPAMLSQGLRIQDSQMYWVEGKPPESLMNSSSSSFRCLCRVRYRQPLMPCTVHLDNSGNGFLFVEFDEPQAAVTPQQIAAFYDSEICLGGGIIDHAVRIGV